MRRLLLPLVLLLALAGAARAQDDRGFITGLLEDNLSAAGREVRIEGFQGALSSRATIETLTIADGEGVWLTLRGVAMQWNRAALLRGRVEIGELAAEEIEVARAPLPDSAAVPLPSEALGSAAAEPFRLPELPVSVEIGTLRAAEVRLGESLLGEAVTLAVEGSLRLAGGEGAADLAVIRTDGREAAVTLKAAFVNATTRLTLDLRAEEQAGGIAARLIGLPGAPALDLSVQGDGPLDDFAATLSLASDGQPRLSGGVRLTGDGAERGFALDVSGDVTALILPEFRDFFGPEVALRAEGRRTEDGTTDLSRFELVTASAGLRGRVRVAPDGLPESFTVTGRLEAPGGGPVRLPVSGDPVTVDRADLAVVFDAASGEQWGGRVILQGFRQSALSLGRVTLSAGGQIGRDAAGAIDLRRVGADIRLSAEGLALADPALRAAVGETLAAEGRVVWSDGQPLELQRLTAETATARVTAAGTLGPVAEGLPLIARGTLSAESLAPFSALAGRDLGGRLVLAYNGTTSLLDGRFDLRAAGAGRDLSAGIDTLDRLLGGAARVRLDARRDEGGILLRDLRLSSDALDATAEGTVAPGATRISVEARVAEAGQVLPGLSGPAALTARLTETGPGVFEADVRAEAPGASRLTFAGRLTEGADATLAADGRLTAEVGRLEAFAGLAGLPVRGRFSAEATGQAGITAGTFRATLAATGEGLGIGQPEADRLLGGTLRLDADLAGAGERVEVRRLALSTREVTADVAGALSPAAGELTGRAQLRDLGLFVPEFPGSLGVTGRLSRLPGGRFGIDIAAEGPGGTRATVAGTAAGDFATADLRIAGDAPLGLANAFIQPLAVQGRAAFDLRLSGPPGLAALSGSVRTGGARVAAPTLGVSLSGLDAAVTLAGGRATVEAAAAVDGGGRLRVAGPVGLTAPYTGDLAVSFAGVRLTDGLLYETEVSGDLRIAGPLAGGARIGGDVTLGRTEIRLASVGVGAEGDLPGLRHVRDRPPVRETRARAGLDGTAGGGAGGAAGGGGPPWPLDLVIRAPNQIFVRGRGLDAELGGILRLGGTSADLIPQGQFELIRGRLDILRRRLDITEGVARLQGAFDPFLRLVATSAAEDVTVRVVVEGLASAPEIRFESQPDLPQDEIVARLVFGRGIDRLSPLQAAQLAGAVATLVGGGGGGIVDRLRQNFGLDDLDVTADENGAAAVRAGRYLSENLYTDVTVGSDGRAEINLNLDVSRSVTVRGRVGSDGNTGIGVYFERDY